MPYSTSNTQATLHLRNGVLRANTRIEEAASTIGLLPVSKRIIRDIFDKVVFTVFQSHNNIIRVRGRTSGIENPRTVHKRVFLFIKQEGKRRSEPYRLEWRRRDGIGNLRGSRGDYRYR